MKTLIKLAPVLVILAVLVLWVASLFLPAFEVHQGRTKVWPGTDVVAMGWLGLVDGHFGWYANLLLLPWLALVVFKPGWAVVIAIVALLLALTSFSLHRGLASDPGRADFVAFHAGFYVWLASHGVAVLGSSVAWRLRAYAGIKSMMD